MKKLKYTALLLFQLLLLSSCSEAAAQECGAPIRQPRQNANVPSDFALDIITDPLLEQRLGNQLFPWTCATAAKLETPECQRDYKATQEFKSQSKTLVKNRNKLFYPTIEKIHDDARKESISQMRWLTADYTAEKFNADFKKIMQYRELIESALFAHKQPQLNCGEQAATAFLDELLRAQEGCTSENTPRKLHYIVLRSSKTASNHGFIVSGSSTLFDMDVNGNKKTVADTLRKMDGKVIDLWNDAAKGGVRMPAKEARKKFNMYGEKAAKAWDSIEVQEYRIEDLHAQLDRKNIPEKLKAILKKIAGPTLDELREQVRLFDSSAPKPC